jgi:site-specific DNA-methyltransferase (adenine-specific)
MQKEKSNKYLIVDCRADSEISEKDLSNLLPGAHVFAICKEGREHLVELFLRKKDYEIRDCLRWAHRESENVGKLMPIILARKPFSGTVVKNCLENKTGALNIDATRVVSGSKYKINRTSSWTGFGQEKRPAYNQEEAPESGRWPSNVLHDGTVEGLSLFDDDFAKVVFYDTSKDGIGIGGLVSYLERMVRPKE